MNVETTTSLIDAALASDAANALDPEERRLQELVLAIRADAPAPDPDFELRLNARVAAGFPRRRGGARKRIHALLTTRPQLAALGVAASLLIALVVVFAGGSGGGSGTGSAGSAVAGSGAASAPSTASSGAAAPAEKTPAPSTASSGASVAVPAPTPIQPGGFVGGRNRKVERSAALVLAPLRDQLSAVGDQVIAVTDRYRGVVLQSSVTSAAGNGSGGWFDLRIPTANLQPALRDLSALADVKSRTENANDVTAPWVSARTRLQELNAERRGLLRRLEHAATDQAAAAIRARIRIVNHEIDAQTSALTDLRRRTSYASVSVTLEPRNRKAATAGTGIGSGARALRDSLIASVNIGLRVLGVALPIAILIAVLWAARGWLTRRRREAALS
jgi:Domain of unknown function (DUF4349)